MRDRSGGPFLILIFVLHHESFNNFMEFVFIEVVLVELTFSFERRDVKPHHLRQILCFFDGFLIQNHHVLD